MPQYKYAASVRNPQQHMASQPQVSMQQVGIFDFSVLAQGIKILCTSYLCFRLLHIMKADNRIQTICLFTTYFLLQHGKFIKNEMLTQVLKLWCIMDVTDNFKPSYFFFQ